MKEDNKFTEKELEELKRLGPVIPQPSNIKKLSIGKEAIVLDLKEQPTTKFVTTTDIKLIKQIGKVYKDMNKINPL